MVVHLLDGTYELFRYFYSPGAEPVPGDYAAVRGVLASVLGMVEGGATHVGVATDHVIESFRNELYPGYKTSAGMHELLLAQFPVLEEALQLMGVLVWPMVEYEADDALASAAAKAALAEQVSQVVICTPDKDLAQCVVGKRIVQMDRMRGILRDEEGVVTKWGIQPKSIPDYLALVGDSADGFPGLPGWGPKSASVTLAEYLHLEGVPKDWRTWPRTLRGAQRLADVFLQQWDDALLFRNLATLRSDAPVFESVDMLSWRGPLAQFGQYCERIQAPGLYARASAAAARSANGRPEKLHSGGGAAL
jgi:5'-3' exonuclease